MGGLSFYPEIPLQHASSFCKMFSVLIRQYVCMNVSVTEIVLSAFVCFLVQILYLAFKAFVSKS